MVAVLLSVNMSYFTYQGNSLVPQLRGDEDVLTLEAGDVSKSLLQTLTNLGLVLVDLGQVLP